MKSTVLLVIFVGSFFATMAQRPPYAGSRPVGYKDRFRPKPTAGAVGAAAAATGSINDIDNRFGENTNNFDSSVSQRPPIGVDVVYGEPPTDQWKQQQQQQPEQQTVLSSSQQPLLLQHGPIVSTAPPPSTIDIAIRQQPEVDIASSSQQSQPTTLTNLAINQNNNPTTISSTDLLTGGPQQQQQQFRPSTVSGSGFVQPQQRPIGGIVTSTPLIPANRPQTTSGHLPYDAHGDTFLVNLLNQRPVDQRPFWLVNYQAIEAHRNGK